MGDGRARIRSRKAAGRIQKVSVEPAAPTNMCQPLLNADGAQWPIFGDKRDKEAGVVSEEAQAFMTERRAER